MNAVVDNGGYFLKELMRLNCHNEKDSIEQQINESAFSLNDGERFDAHVFYEMVDRQLSIVFTFLVTDGHDEDTGETMKFFTYQYHHILEG